MNIPFLVNIFICGGSSEYEKLFDVYLHGRKVGKQIMILSTKSLHNIVV